MIIKINCIFLTKFPAIRSHYIFLLKSHLVLEISFYSQSFHYELQNPKVQDVDHLNWT